MADEPSQAPVEESLEDAPQVEETETQRPDEADSDTNWEQRFKDTQAEFTRKSQELSQYELIVAAAQDSEHPQHAEALDLLGLQYEEADDDVEDDEEEHEVRDPRVDEMLERQQSEEYEAAEHAYITGHIEGIEKELGRTLDDEEADAVGTLSTAMRGDDGAPDVRAAYELIYKTLLPKERARWTSSKRQAATAPVGVPGSEKVNLNDDQTRKRLLAEAIEAEADSG